MTVMDEEWRQGWAPQPSAVKRDLQWSQEYLKWLWLKLQQPLFSSLVLYFTWVLPSWKISCCYSIFCVFKTLSVLTFAKTIHIFKQLRFICKISTFCIAFQNKCGTHQMPQHFETYLEMNLFFCQLILLLCLLTTLSWWKGTFFPKVIY